MLNVFVMLVTVVVLVRVWRAVTRWQAARRQVRAAPGRCLHGTAGGCEVCAADAMSARLKVCRTAVEAHTAYLTLLHDRLACTNAWSLFELAVAHPVFDLTAPTRTPESFDVEIAAAFDEFATRFAEVDPRDLHEVPPLLRHRADPTARQVS
jgi:hypothetical protein